MYKKHTSFSFTALLFMPCLSEHERPAAIGLLKVVHACFWRRQIL